jgi:putative transposase
MIKKESNSDFPVEKMCQTLKVSRSGFYDWDGRGLSERQREDEKILEVLTKKYTEAQGMIGLNKLYKDVREAGFTCGRNRVYRLQKANQLYSVRNQSTIVRKMKKYQIKI